MPSFLVLWLLFSVGLPWAGPTGSPSASQGKSKSASRTAGSSLDTALVQSLYMDGEFDSAITILEQARRQGRLRTITDSVFAFKYLAVMYAATYATVEKGKQLMMLLLRIDPSAGILDMHASDMIYMIFRNVQSEMSHSRPVPGQDPQPIRQGDTATAASGARRSRLLYWTAGSAVAAAGIGVILYLTLSGSDPGEGNHYEGGFP